MWDASILSTQLPPRFLRHERRLGMPGFTATTRFRASTCNSSRVMEHPPPRISSHLISHDPVSARHREPIKNKKAKEENGDCEKCTHQGDYGSTPSRSLSLFTAPSSSPLLPYLESLSLEASIRLIPSSPVVYVSTLRRPPNLGRPDRLPSHADRTGSRSGVEDAVLRGSGPPDRTA